MIRPSHRLVVAAGAALLIAFLAGCAKPADTPRQAANADQAPAAGEAPDAVSQASPNMSNPDEWAGKELPVRKIPNVPENAEAYYAPDNLHVIAQTQDKASQDPGEGRAGGALTYTFTDTGEEVTRINDHGQDACSWFFPDGQRLVWTSTRDHMDMPLGNWSDETEYPQGAELYVSDLKGGDIRRLTNNNYYEAEVTTSNDGQWVFFGRQIDGKMDIWKMRVDGTDEQQLTFTDDWQEGAPYPTPDGEHLIFRAWKRSEILANKKMRQETGGHRQTSMTIFTMKTDGTDVQPRTFTNDMNWAPFIAPDGQHFFYVRVFEDNNWEVVMNDLAGGEPVRITWNKTFDGFPSISPNGQKMLFGRSTGKRFMSGIYTHVMDISALNVGPGNFKGSIPPRAKRPEGWVEDPGLEEYGDRLGT
ncbi:MAG: PD40 domain-containing protein [Rhodoferax sp.]|jgi:TolB protein|nr:PD40 domain-containing protein [Chromatiales bacterium]MBP6851583.1 PD40 domain-containing protein [Rhodoferax sp.]